MPQACGLHLTEEIKNSSEVLANLKIIKPEKIGGESVKTKDIARAVIFVAIAVALSPFFIPVGISKCFPAQHMVNVMSAVMLGPAYAVGIAFIAAIIRNILGLGTLLAFPGGMIGALLAGLAYRQLKNLYFAGLGEIIGTGLLGALVSVWIVGPLLMSKSMAVVTLIIAFSVSTLGGTIIGIIALKLLQKAGIWEA
ncbi:MAG: energy coupling factor transporter S component ThiW [Deltaproteobacteria bacterium]|nr:energy coupling factor transporter S component ThiW [Deltaproteobacteria bacterium]